MSVRRRLFIGALVLGLWWAPPPALDAQPAGKVRIAYLSGNPEGDTRDAIAALLAKLRELGYREGQNLAIEYRYADGKYDKLPQLTADLIRRKVDVILAYGTPAARAAKQTSVPIVFGVVSDPRAAGLVASLARPGSNVTGVTANNPELSAKRVGLLKEVAPAAVRMTVLANPDFQPTRSKLAETRHAAQSLGVDLRVLEARAPADLARSFDAMARAGAQGVIVLADPMFIAQRRQIAELALRGRLPSMYHLRQFAEAGGLLSYGADYRDLFQQSAVLIDKILKGAKPADLPVEQPWRYALVVNLKTASALGLTVPQSVLIQADDVLR